MPKQILRGCLVTVVQMVVLALAVTGAEGQEEAFHAWVGLHNPERVGWLENENQLNNLCSSAEDIGFCYGEMLAPAIDVYPLYVDRYTTSPTVGDLIVATVPGRGLSGYYRPIDASQGIPFQPDVFLRDWGYGPPYFHQTVVREEGVWLQLPPDPWDGPVWIRRDSAESEPSILEVQAGTILEIGGRGMFVVATTAESLTLRPEQAADMWCEEGNPPPLLQVPATVYSRAELVDDRGHLIIRPKYMKGC
jgi:hypothetical protein